jgi:hypothetical protein
MVRRRRRRRKKRRDIAITPASVHDDGEGESVDLADEDEKQAPKRLQDSQRQT